MSLTKRNLIRWVIVIIGAGLMVVIGVTVSFYAYYYNTFRDNFPVMFQNQTGQNIFIYIDGLYALQVDAGEETTVPVRINEVHRYHVDVKNTQGETIFSTEFKLDRQHLPKGWDGSYNIVIPASAEATGSSDNTSAK